MISVAEAILLIPARAPISITMRPATEPSTNAATISAAILAAPQSCMVPQCASCTVVPVMCAVKV